MRACVVGKDIWANIWRSGGDANDVLDACSQGIDEELALFDKLVCLDVWCDEDPHNFMLTEPGIVNLDPKLLCKLDARQLCQCLSRWTTGASGEREDAVRGELGILQQLWQSLDDAAASVASRTDNEDGGAMKAAVRFIQADEVQMGYL